VDSCPNCSSRNRLLRGKIEREWSKPQKDTARYHWGRSFQTGCDAECRDWFGRVGTFPTNAALEAAVAASADDDTPRLAYADWLDEHGDHDTTGADALADPAVLPRLGELWLSSNKIPRKSAAKIERDGPYAID
jgi:uncharacterized protein (TIGR02996 family)